MNEKLRNALLTLLALLMLAGFAAAVPSGAITPSAQRQYLEQGVDDEYAFLFDN